MVERDQRQFPEWAEQERADDLAWIRENLHIFWPAAQLGYETVGRGAIVVVTTIRASRGGHPFGYFDQAAIEQRGDEDTQRIVKEYEPTRPREMLSLGHISLLAFLGSGCTI